MYFLQRIRISLLRTRQTLVIGRLEAYRGDDIVCQNSISFSASELSEEQRSNDPGTAANVAPFERTNSII
jgi:hypothetical protein